MKVNVIHWYLSKKVSVDDIVEQDDYLKIIECFSTYELKKLANLVKTENNIPFYNEIQRELRNRSCT